MMIPDKSSRASSKESSEMPSPTPSTPEEKPSLLWTLSMLLRDKAEPFTVSEADSVAPYLSKPLFRILYFQLLIFSSFFDKSSDRNFLPNLKLLLFQFQSTNMKYKNVPIRDIVIHKHPLLYIQLLFKVVADLLVWLKDFLIQRFFVIIIVASIVAVVTNVQFLHPLQTFIAFMVYWIILGVASSIGLGTGLHTFVLYLGPHIAKVAMVATSCGHLPKMVPNRWEFQHFDQCETTSDTIGFFGILLAVQIQAFLWGFGTALGQLPPYFVAKKASDTREQLLRREQESAQKSARSDEERKKLLQTAQQIDEIQKLKSQPNKTFMDKAKILIFDNMEKYGFITILLCASIPNPLFDLAGITCGHFRIPFKKFFSATFIGKAIIKTHIQMLFVITVFRKETVSKILEFIAKFSSGFSQTLSDIMEKQRQNLYHPKDSNESKPMIGRLWDMFIILMVGYFLLSIVTSQVQEKAVQIKDKEN